MLRANYLLFAKDGLLPSECEDAVGIRLDLGRVCVADGATESFDSRSWARMLTKHWAKSRGLLDRTEMEPWWAELGSRLSLRWSKRNLPWYAEEKAATGAFAAFVGVALAASDTGQWTWSAVALGDACLVHRRGDQILQSLPISDPGAFGYHPQLVPSVAASQIGLAEHVTLAESTALPGDTFLLLTDAIAAWYLRQVIELPQLAHEFDRLMEINSQAEVRSLLRQERETRRLRNDDVAVVSLSIVANTPRIG